MIVPKGEFVAAVALLLAGCIPIPLPNPEPYREQTLGALAPGSTRAEVLFTMGAPSWAHDEDRIFVYGSDERKMAVVVILGNQTAGGVGGATVSKRHLLVIEFDESGLVRYIEPVDLGLGLSLASPEPAGFDEVVCTSWNLCLGHSGASIVAPESANAQ